MKNVMFCLVIIVCFIFIGCGGESQSSESKNSDEKQTKTQIDKEETRKERKERIRELVDQEFEKMKNEKQTQKRKDSDWVTGYWETDRSEGWGAVCIYETYGGHRFEYYEDDGFCPAQVKYNPKTRQVKTEY